MGLKWFRARLSIEKAAAKVPEMAGLYRRISFSESSIQRTAEVSVSPVSFASYSTASDDNETVPYDRSKEELTSQSSLSINDSEEITIKNNDKKLKINNHAVENAEPSTSNKDLNIKEPSTCNNESNKITKNQNDVLDTSPICADNELVI
ncbi:PREDICTED: uncharacterized protein LOC105561765 [Vollenhovia emeryi]|uniref:uncharacterized protein LOC105561765 n=1 Tax=Vollenhovia emeryi TaxID=411798 RepID=UPI0005F48808|nr:PREDICTED: uncharacterized protein LOC105561765 [Vollenhovia emeryi]